MESEEIILLVALPAEAKPLIRAFGLQRQQPDGAFPCYSKDSICLILTGPGLRAAGDAVSFAMQRASTAPAFWINLGIAGHSQLAPGSCLLADKIKHPSTGREWRLQPPAGLTELIMGSLRCVDQPETGYAEAAGYDMESAAIAEALSENGLLPRLQVVKIISDNPLHPARGISARMVGDLIQAQLPLIEGLIKHLQQHAQAQ